MYAFRARFTASVNARDVIVAPVMASMSPPSCLTARGDDVPVMLWELSLSVERNHRSMRAPSPGVSEWERTLKPLTAPSEQNPTSKVIRPLKPASEYVSIAAPTGVPANVAGYMFSPSASVASAMGLLSNVGRTAFRASARAFSAAWAMGRSVSIRTPAKAVPANRHSEVRERAIVKGVDFMLWPPFFVGKSGSDAYSG